MMKCYYNNKHQAYRQSTDCHASSADVPYEYSHVVLSADPLADV